MVTAIVWKETPPAKTVCAGCTYAQECQCTLLGGFKIATRRCLQVMWLHPLSFSMLTPQLGHLFAVSLSVCCEAASCASSCGICMASYSSQSCPAQGTRCVKQDEAPHSLHVTSGLSSPGKWICPELHSRQGRNAGNSFNAAAVRNSSYLDQGRKLVSHIFRY